MFLGRDNGLPWNAALDVRVGSNPEVAALARHVRSTLKSRHRQAVRHVRLVPIVLKKSFWGDERNFLEPLMRFTRGDVRDHIDSSKIDHGPS